MIALARRRLAVPFLLVAASGCSKNEEYARERFGVMHSCPVDTVTIKKRPDLKWSAVGWSGSNESPPAEVAADPVRLAKWKEDQAKTYEPLIKSLDEHDVYEAHGCGHDGYVGCKTPAKTNGPTPRYVCEVANVKTPSPAGSAIK